MLAKSHVKTFQDANQQPKGATLMGTLRDSMIRQKRLGYLTFNDGEETSVLTPRLLSVPFSDWQPADIYEEFDARAKRMEERLAQDAQQPAGTVPIEIEHRQPWHRYVEDAIRALMGTGKGEPPIADILRVAGIGKHDSEHHAATVYARKLMNVITGYDSTLAVPITVPQMTDTVQ
jgi:hypothetical protein